MSEYWQIESATDVAFKAAKRAANKLSKPEKVQGIIRKQEQAMDAEQRLDEAYTRGCLLYYYPLPR